ncbi:MAG TPA: hypothetical protein VF831_09450 [Anaerolineales bacterium]
MKSDRRGSWYLLTGAVLGIAAGLLYAWVISPVQYIDAPPYALRAGFKDDYRALVAAAYLYSGDLLRAQDRLVQLKDDNPAQSLALQAQQAMADGHPEEEVRALGLLTLALAQGITPQPSPNPPDLMATNDPTAREITPTPQYFEPIENPALSPEISPATELQLQDMSLICNPDLTMPLLQVQVQDSNGQTLQPVELVVTWEGGEEHFVTGSNPQLGPGYGDFQITPGVIYTLDLASGGQIAKDLIAAECLSVDQASYWGSWMLTLIQP